jgi:hypothetical protein
MSASVPAAFSDEMDRIELIHDLGVLAKRIRGHDEQARYHAGAMASARDAGRAEMLLCGQALRRAKVLCGHGRFEGWVREHCGFSIRTARSYMELAANRQDVADMGEGEKGGCGFKLTVGWLSGRLVALAKKLDPQVVLAWSPEERARVVEALEPVARLWAGLKDANACVIADGGLASGQEACQVEGNRGV